MSKLTVKDTGIKDFIKLYGVTEVDILSDEFMNQVEKNGYGVYYMDGSLTSILTTWDEEFEGERGSIENSLTIYNVDGLYIAMWN